MKLIDILETDDCPDGKCPITALRDEDSEWAALADAADKASRRYLMPAIYDTVKATESEFVFKKPGSFERWVHTDLSTSGYDFNELGETDKRRVKMLANNKKFMSSMKKMWAIYSELYDQYGDILEFGTGATDGGEEDSYINDGTISTLYTVRELIDSM